MTVLAPTAPPARTDLEYREPRLFPSPLYSRWDSAEVVHTVVDVRRAVDLLAEHPSVDPDRIGFVGHMSSGRQPSPSDSPVTTIRPWGLRPSRGRTRPATTSTTPKATTSSGPVGRSR